MKTAAFAVIILIAVAICGPFLFFNQTLYLADLTYNYQPAAEYVRDHGKPWPFFPAFAPLWNPYILNGVPQVAVTWPLLYWPLFMGFLFPGSVGLGVLFALHLIIGGGGFFLWYSQRLGMETHFAYGTSQSIGASSGESTDGSSGESHAEPARGGGPGTGFAVGISALFGAIVAMMNGYVMGSTINISLGSTVAWAPLVLYFIDRVIAVNGWNSSEGSPQGQHQSELSQGSQPGSELSQSKQPSNTLKAARFSRWTDVSMLGFVLSQQLTAGRPEIFAGFALLYFVYVVATLLVAHLVPLKRSGLNGLPKIMVPLALMVVASVLATGIGACNLLPLHELIKNSPPIERLNPLGTAFWSAGWFDLAGMAMSQPLGDISPGNYTYYPTYPGSMPYITSLFIGVPVLVLSVLGFSRRNWRWRWFWFATMAVSFLVAAGEFGPLMPWLLKQFPFLSLLRFPIKFAAFMLLPLIIAAAQGLHSVVCREVKALAGWIILAVFLLPLPLVLWAWTSPDMQAAWVKLVGNMDERTFADMTPMVVQAGRRLVEEVTVQAIAGALCGALVILIIRATSRKLQMAGAAGVVLLSAGLLFLNGTRHLWHTVDMSFFTSRSSIATWIQQQEKQLPSMYRVLSLIEDPVPEPPILTKVPARQVAENFMAYGRDILRPNTNIESDVRLSNGMTVVPTWSSLFLSNGVLPRSSQADEVKHPAGVSDLPLKRYCRLTSTRYVITLKSKVDGEGNYVDLPLLDQRMFHLVKEDAEKNIRLYDAGSVRPRVAMLSEIVLMPDRDAIFRELNRAPQDRLNSLKQSMVVDERLDGSALKGAAKAVYQTIDLIRAPMYRNERGEGSKFTCVLEEETAEHLKITADCSNLCLLVLSATFYPGWTATDNGRETPVLLADGMQQSILLEAGRHDIEFFYKPVSYLVGLWISAICCLLCIAGVLGGLLLSIRARKAATL